MLSNDMFVNSLYNSHVCAVLVSEEQDEPIIVEESMSGDKSALMVVSIFKTFALQDDSA